MLTLNQGSCLMSHIKQFILILCCSTSLYGASPAVPSGLINSGLISSVIKISGEDHLLVSMIIPATALSALAEPMTNNVSLLQKCIDVENNRKKQIEVQEVIAAGYDGAATSPKSMALDLLSQKEIGFSDHAELIKLRRERRSLQRKLDESKESLSLLQEKKAYLANRLDVINGQLKATKLKLDETRKELKAAQDSLLK